MNSKQSPSSKTTMPEVGEVVRLTNQASLRLVIPEELAYFKGHFAGLPLLPGVVQLDWVVQYSKELFMSASFSAINIRVKFRKPIEPRHQLTLTLKYFVSVSEVEFDYADQTGCCSLGRIGFAAA